MFAWLSPVVQARDQKPFARNALVRNPSVPGMARCPTLSPYFFTGQVLIPSSVQAGQ